MILKALYDYYHRLGTLPPPGMEMKEIPYIIVIDSEGRLKRFESTRIDAKRSTEFCVPKAVVRRGREIKPNLLWDNNKYVLDSGVANALFVDKIKETANLHPNDKSLQALLKFYAIPEEERTLMFGSDPLFEEIEKSKSANFSFQLEGEDRIIAEKRELLPKEIDSDLLDGAAGICLVTGKKGQIVRLTTPTPLPGNAPSAAIVGIQKASGYDSYGKKQAYNSPISPEAEFAYSSALKSLLGKDSRNKVKIGKRVFLFWSNSDRGTEIEECMSDFFAFEADNKSNPNEKISRIEKLFKGIWSGEVRTTLEDRFYILGLAPNVGRIAVVEWNDTPLKEFAAHLLRHFDDMDIVDSRPIAKRRPFAGIYAMIANVTLGGKTSDSLPSLVEGVFSAVVEGGQYPLALYTGALDRIRSELSDHTVSPGRAAILKAYINRKYQHNSNIKSLTTMLDKTNDNPAYLCGRLTAVLEKIQKDANCGDSIRTRYLAAASATPATIFPAMLNLSVHHSANLEPGMFIHYEKLKGEIISHLSSTGFPVRLDLIDQGRFFVGYYHQQADLFTKKNTNQ